MFLNSANSLTISKSEYLSEDQNKKNEKKIDFRYLHTRWTTWTRPPSS